MNSIELLKKLIDDNECSKYQIAKKIGVSWNTVHQWYRDIHFPRDNHQQKIKDIYGEKYECNQK